jgi:DNA-directed RNA polymerase specialized sigma24 family protein
MAEPMTVEEALKLRAEARAQLAAAIQALPPGKERRDGIRAVHEAGMGATSLARLLGISRQRVYELLDES